MLPLAFAIAGTVLVLALTLRARLASGTSSAGLIADAASFQMRCGICQKDLVIHPNQLVKLSGPELALSVRVKPKLVGRPLAEYVCPYCEASHCFAVDVRPPECVGTNLYLPRGAGALCMECGKPLRKPPWPIGYFDGRLNEAPELHPDYGLICSRCQAVTCVACVKDATRNRTKDGSFVCPRCMRSPVTGVFHPS
jgi:hypothetical protein